MAKRWSMKEHRALVKSVHERTSGLKRKKGGVRRTIPISIWKQVAEDVSAECGTSRTHNGVSKMWRAISEDVQTTMLVNDVVPALDKKPTPMEPKVVMAPKAAQVVTGSNLMWLDQLELQKGEEYLIRYEGKIDGRRLVSVYFDRGLSRKAN
jgi:hypothetical protein